MSSCCGNFQCSFHVLLSFYIGEIKGVVGLMLIEFFPCIDHSWNQLPLFVEEFDDFLDVFEVSPIPASIDITLNADYVSADSLEVVRAEIAKSSLVDEVVYQRSLVDALNANLSRISLILGVFIALLLFISFVLINNTVRLNVFARRFTIHTMKLVGATKQFIRAPFLVQSAFQGIFAAMISIVVLVGILFFVKSEFAQLFEIFRLELLLLVMGIVLVSGLVICVVSTYFVVGKLVTLKKDELYY